MRDEEKRGWEEKPSLLCSYERDELSSSSSVEKRYHRPAAVARPVKGKGMKAQHKKWRVSEVEQECKQRRPEEREANRVARV